ncbi:hypothetical protein RI570_21365 [Brucella pseudogrignonensis]|uniref:hypothetical protein n=1 Tax=Brucella pseudogrignonensis TaxID=419475 RepID=UPI0028B95213|nr:hypothetical protein [Brucella pseudogrignonensis]MDT6940775.1 hypothetical protein [Brucella pseudogrignonensis]MDT6942602.1 hypothetical protein [Brucella pseudogrignonensis]
MEIDWGFIAAALALVAGLSTFAYKAPGVFNAVTSTISIALSVIGICYVMYAVGYSNAFNELKYLSTNDDFAKAKNPYNSNWLFLASAVGFVFQSLCRLILYVANHVRAEEAKKAIS